MSTSRKAASFFIFAAIVFIVFILYGTATNRNGRKEHLTANREEVDLDPSRWSVSGSNGSDWRSFSRQIWGNPPFRNGVPKPPGSAYSRIMVVPRMKEDNVSWIAEELPEMNVAIYVTNDPTAPLHPPKNKGHEVMIYLTYIIDHYSQLPDVVIFMHAHRWTHHNNELLSYDAPQMIRRLSNEHVTREGYVNMRCLWSPGCPDWLHPDNKQETIGKQEEPVLAKCWSELFPLYPLPKSLAQPCCAQFALSEERIRSIPLGRYIFYRDWILRTPLSDYISGRIWEYSWQFLFTGQSILCPSEHVCYCDGFGVCFGGEAEYKAFENLRQMKQDFESEAKDLRQQQRLMGNGVPNSELSTVSLVQAYVPGRLSYLHDQASALDKELTARKKGAIKRGDDPRNRAEECGRQWIEGDGF